MKALNSVHPVHDTALEQARRLWCAAEYSACLELLNDEEPSAERFLLAAWAYYRLRRYDDALGAIARGHALFHSNDVRVEADALSSVLHQILGNERESDVFAERAVALDSRSIFTRAGNMLALRAWLRDDLAECLRRLRAGEASPDGNIRAYAVSIRSWTLASRRQFAEHARLLQQTLEITLSAPVPDVGLAAETLHTLSALCREMYLPQEFTVLEGVVEGFPWTADLRNQQYNTLRHIAWTYALQGQYVVGLRQLRKATALAPNSALVALSMLDAAWVALSSGEKNAAQAHLSDALELVREVNWEKLESDEMRAVLLAAEISCVFDVREARELLARYESLKGNLSVRLGAKHAGNLDPVESFTRALVLSGTGDVSRARKFAKEAHRQFKQLGYEWRAARCALFLYESGCGETWLAAAREHARNYPRSFIGAQLQRIDYESNFEPLARLTPRQRDVVRLLVEGDTVDDVAAALRTSPSTVRVHLKHIHRALGVRNRVELLRAVKPSA